MVTKKTKILTLALATIVAAGGVAFAINNNKMSSASAANTNTSSETKGTTEDGFSYTIKDGVVTITGYNFNPNNDTFYGMKASNGHYYGFCKSSKTYKEAKELCKKSGGYLISIDSQEEKDAVQQLLRAEDNYDIYFIGKSSVGEKICGEDELDSYGSMVSYLASEEGLQKITNSADYPLFVTLEKDLGDFSRMSYDEQQEYNNQISYSPSWVSNFYCYTKYDITGHVICEWDENSKPKNFHEINPDLVIPEKIEGKPVKFLSKDTFKKLTKYKLRNYIKSIDIKAQLYQIEEGTFENAENLESVTLPDSLLYIQTNAFRHCFSLKSITIPDKTTCIGKHSFERSGLKEINFGKKVKTINDHAFDSTNITSLNIPSTVRTIGEGAFIHCTSLKNVTMEDGVTTIKYGAFDCCDELSSINFPASVKSLASDVIRCTGMEKFVIPANAKIEPADSLITFDADPTIPAYAYGRTYDTPRINYVIFENGRKKIDSNCIDGIRCRLIIVPESVTTIENNAFVTGYDGTVYLPQSFSGKSETELNAMIGSDKKTFKFYSEDSEWEADMNDPLWWMR